MVGDQNFLKVKRTLVTIFLFTLFINYSFADNLKFKKIVNLKGPWGSTFISDTELLITEKSGEIKLIDLNTKKISSLNKIVELNRKQERFNVGLKSLDMFELY